MKRHCGSREENKQMLICEIVIQLKMLIPKKTKANRIKNVCLSTNDCCFLQTQKAEEQ